MKRITIAGLFLVALALGAVTASSAMAEEIPPEYGQCLAQKKGDYGNNTCTVEAAKEHHGKYEWHPGPPNTCIAVKKGNYTNKTCTTEAAKKGTGKFEKEPGAKYTSSTGPGKLEAPLLANPVECETSEGFGEITGVTTATNTTIFKNCQIGGKVCHNRGTNEIETKKLELFLIGHEGPNPPGYGALKPIQGEVWTQFSGPGGRSGPSAEWECAGIGKSRTVGWLDSKTTPINKMGTTATFEFSESLGEFGVLLTEVNTGGGWGAPAKSIEDLLGTNKSEAKIETRIQN